MSYSGGFGRAPRHHAPRHDEHSSRRSHANMERAMNRYEDPRGREPSERSINSYDAREEYPRTQRRSTHGYDRMQENRAHGFPDEYDFNSYQQHLILTNHRQALEPQSRSAPTRPNCEHVLESHNSAGIEGPWFAEFDRRGNRPRPGYEIIGYWTDPREQDGGGRVFVPNPYLTGRMAAVAAERAANPPPG